MAAATEDLYALDAAYRWNADLMICRHCRRMQQITWREHAFPHSPGCRLVNAEPRPWLRLAEAIAAAPRAGVVLMAESPRSNGSATRSR